MTGQTTEKTTGMDSFGFQFPQKLPELPNNFMGGMDIQLKDEDAKDAMTWQGSLSAGTTAVNAMISGFNYGLAGQQIGAQKEIGKAYYHATEKVAGYKMQVAMREMDIRENGMYIQQQMLGSQQEHEERLMRLEGSAQVRIAQIQESGKTERARQISVTDAFSARRSYGFGMPSYDIQ